MQDTPLLIFMRMQKFLTRRLASDRLRDVIEVLHEPQCDSQFNRTVYEHVAARVAICVNLGVRLALRCVSVSEAECTEFTSAVRCRSRWAARSQFSILHHRASIGRHPTVLGVSAFDVRAMSDSVANSLDLVEMGDLSANEERNTPERCGVNDRPLACEHFKSNASLGEVVDDIDQMPQVSTQPAKFAHQQSVRGAQRFQASGQLRLVVLLAGS